MVDFLIAGHILEMSKLEIFILEMSKLEIFILEIFILEMVNKLKNFIYC